MNIGFIGLGHMGQPMASNLCQKGFSVTVFDLVPTAVAALVDLGATAAQDIPSLASKCDIIITMLPQGEHVEAVCLTDNGLFAHAKAGTLIIDCSSIAVDMTRELARLANLQGLLTLDAPVSGGVTGATNGTLTFMVGGPAENLERARPLFEAMGKHVLHAGATGNGQAAKICNNMLLGISMIGTAEAFVLANKLGLSNEAFFNIASVSSGQCWSMTSYCPVPGPVPTSPANRDYQAGFTTAMMLKDLRLSQAAAAKVSASTPLGAEATALYTLLNNNGLAQADFSAIIQLLQGTLH